MKGKNTLLFFLIVALIAGLAFVAINGITIGTFSISPVKDDLKLGLDIRGGVSVVYEAQTDESGADLTKTMEQTKQIIGRRINELGLTEPVITLQGDKRLRIELPGVENAQDAINVIGKTAVLEFDLVTGSVAAKEGMDVSEFEYERVLTGINIKDAYVSKNSYNQPIVAFKLDSEGTDLFAEGTRKASSNGTGVGQIAVVLDGKVISAPTSRVVITSGEATIDGNFTYDTANELAMLIRGGALPVQLEEVQTSVIGPTLGLNSFNSAIKAAIYGIIIVMLFMMIYYRIPGIIASIALTLYATVVVYVMVGLGATLTLPGIAGIVISLGMAVDANVIIFERLKEEMKVGKSLRASIDGGFHRAMSTIIDSNVTTFIAALILFAFGEGPIKGFAVTLMIGIISSMFTAVIVTKSLLRFSLAFTDRKKLYGSRG
ncbi:protein translocase subunit SecD [Fusibacter bizertensis]|jgi:protein-export membrane protein, SecD/SecF family/protein-export membrane protein SecD|uniref:Protein translocase subunit SecD n=1 Tax=Fusibacter bizertensis TaxID=1488331 RepID=A0ABT6N9P2_9FIRM|nr:protein translocase subunit SecD [Fusibacter bizertensis]MDH8677138.1 protein translocase subunit SecD [Fusibacter bizertensis]